MSTVGEGYVSIPLSEFENLHEHVRVLQAKIAQLEEQVQGYYEFSKVSAFEARRWRAVVAATHVEGRGHGSRWDECPSAICVAARMGK